MNLINQPSLRPTRKMAAVGWMSLLGPIVAATIAPWLPGLPLTLLSAHTIVCRLQTAGHLIADAKLARYSASSLSATKVALGSLPTWSCRAHLRRISHALRQRSWISYATVHLKLLR